VRRRRPWLLIALVSAAAVASAGALGYVTGRLSSTEEGLPIHLLLAHPPASPPVDT
jgi:hypothetical protein